MAPAPDGSRRVGRPPCAARILNTCSPPDELEAARVANQGAAGTTPAILTGLGALGARDLPELGAATLALDARVPYGAPALLDYVSLPWRRAPLDRRVEDLAGAHGVAVRSRSRLVLPGTFSDGPGRGSR